MDLNQNNERPTVPTPMTEAQIEAEAVKWLEDRQAALSRKRSNFKPRGGHYCGHHP
jgi:hypothetical protein